MPKNTRPGVIDGSVKFDRSVDVNLLLHDLQLSSSEPVLLALILDARLPSSTDHHSPLSFYRLKPLSPPPSWTTISDKLKSIPSLFYRLTPLFLNMRCQTTVFHKPQELCFHDLRKQTIFLLDSPTKSRPLTSLFYSKATTLLDHCNYH